MVLGIFVLIGGFAVVLSMDSYRSYNVHSERSLLLGVLLKARSQAMANVNQKNHGVHFDQPGVTYTLFQGLNYASRDPSFDIIFKSNPSYTLTGAIDVIFNQLNGKPNAPDSITLDDHALAVFNVCINSEGQINEKATCP